MFYADCQDWFDDLTCVDETAQATLSSMIDQILDELDYSWDIAKDPICITVCVYNTRSEAYDPDVHMLDDPNGIIKEGTPLYYPTDHVSQSEVSVYFNDELDCWECSQCVTFHRAPLTANKDNKDG